MFGLDPFSRPVAITEILLLLALAAFIGWLLGRLVLAGRISSLRSALADKKNELDECRSAKAPLRSRVDVIPTASATAAANEDRAVEPPQFFVPADPLLPAYTHDDTPAPVVELPPIDQTLPPISSTLEFPPIEETMLASTSTTEDRETVILNRIAARASELNFDRIGRAVATEADDLKDIVGVGPFLERKLHTLGIYTFRQVANFSSEDIEKVNEIIEFFPGRIERDNWVGQARTFYERKYGNRSK
ncbi:hypothetical protein [Spirosoma koreense]